MRPLTVRVAKGETAGEVMLALIADCLERGEMPPAETVEAFTSAVDGMLAESDADMRRIKLMQGLGLYRKEGNQRTATDDPARMFWLMRLAEGLPIMKARAAVADFLNVSDKTVETAVKRHPEAEQWARGVVALHRD